MMTNKVGLVTFLTFSIFEKKNQFSTVVVDDDHGNSMSNGMGSKSMDSINSYGGSRNNLDEQSQEQSDDVEKARLISQVLELQVTLDDLNQRVDGVKEENLRLKSENMVLGQYIDNLMSVSETIFSQEIPSEIIRDEACQLFFLLKATLLVQHLKSALLAELSSNKLITENFFGIEFD